MRLYIHNTNIWMYIHTCSYGSNFPKTWGQKFLTRYVQLLVSLWEMFRTINLEVLSCNIYKHRSPSHSNDEAEDTFPQPECHEYRHHSLPTAASPMSNTSIFLKCEKWQYKSQNNFRLYKWEHSLTGFFYVPLTRWKESSISFFKQI